MAGGQHLIQGYPGYALMLIPTVVEGCSTVVEGRGLYIDTLWKDLQMTD